MRDEEAVVCYQASKDHHDTMISLSSFRGHAPAAFQFCSQKRVNGKLLDIAIMKFMFSIMLNKDVDQSPVNMQTHMSRDKAFVRKSMLDATKSLANSCWGHWPEVQVYRLSATCVQFWFFCLFVGTVLYAPTFLPRGTLLESIWISHFARGNMLIACLRDV